MPSPWAWVVSTRSRFSPRHADEAAWRSAMVRHALERGVRLFYVPPTPRAPRELATLEAELGAEGSTPTATVLAVPGLATADVDLLASRPKGPSELWLELPSARLSEAAATALNGLESSGRVAAWGVDRTRGPASRETLARDRALGASFVRLPGSLLSGRDERAAIADAGAVGLSRLLDDPFASGRLDGSWLTTSSVERPSLRGPPSFSSLQQGWSPVLALGFLTERTGRTLPVAALQYARRLAGDGAVLVEAATAEAFEDLARVAASPPLAPEELARIERLADAPGRGDPSPLG